MPPPPLTHIFLSAHPDDVVLSCGGLLHQLVAQQQRVVVITVCAGEPSKGLLSELAEELHTRWASSAGWPSPLTAKQVVNLRREEDLAALAALDAEAVHLTLSDAIYRRDPMNQRPLYPATGALFAPLPAAEETLVRRAAHQLTTLLQGFGRQQVYAPLGLGNHVDHQITRRATEQSARIFAYYEDYPYATGEAGLKTTPAQLPASDRLLRPLLMSLTEADLAAKLQAIQHYKSQLSSFWPSAEAMAAAVRQFAQQVGGATLAERLWRVN